MAEVSRGASASQERHKSKSIAFSVLANKRNVSRNLIQLSERLTTCNWPILKGNLAMDLVFPVFFSQKSKDGAVY